MRTNNYATAGTPEDANRPTARRQVRVTTDGEWVTVADPIERRQDRCRTTPPADLTPIDADTLGAPVDVAVSATLKSLVFDRLSIVVVRNLETGTVAHVAEEADERFEAGRYRLEVTGPIKLYLEVDAGVTVQSTDGTRISFDELTDVAIGARSLHQRPATTITVPPDPRAMMRAVSAFGSALKTTSPERAWPTLRGHPPALELGRNLRIPRGVAPPVPEIEIVVPETFEHVYVAAPLAYYLGARVVPGESPHLRTNDGFEHSLEDPDGFESGVERVLRQNLFLDCLVRSVGQVQFPLAEKQAIDSAISMDYQRLYDLDPTDRLREYLSIPYDTITDHVPDWEITSYVDTTPEQSEVLPYLLNDLAIIRTDPDGVDEKSSRARALEDAGSIASVIRGGDVTESTADTTPTDPRPTETMLPSEADSLETNWAGDGIPLGGSKVTKQAFENQFETEPGDPPITATVVCNEQEMDREIESVDEVYDPELPFAFEVDVRQHLTTDEFRRVLEQPTEFLHYVGHCEPEGLSCTDGYLDIADLDEVNVESFLLNACSSYEQGLALIDQGSIGGIVTHGPVLDSTATRVGPVIARLLNAGYPLRAALDIAEETTLSDQYLIVGHGGHTVVQSDGTSNVYSIDRVDEETFEVAAKSYFSTAEDVGTVFRPHLEGFDYHLVGNTTETVEASREALEEWIWRGQYPVRVGDELHWNMTLSLDDL